MHSTNRCNFSVTQHALRRTRRFTPVVSCDCGSQHGSSSSDRDSACWSLRLGPTQALAAAALGAFLRRRRWLRSTPEAPLQLVRVLDPPVSAAGAPLPRPPPRPALRHNNNNAAVDNVDSSCSSSNRISSSGPAGSAASSFYILRDDLLHPVLGGNKVRKLDALIPELLAEEATDVITCGGVQSAHLAAVAVVAAEAGLRSHLLVRGEQPQVPTGYHLVTRMYGTEVSYISRAEYADRQAMLSSRAAAVRARNPDAKVAVVSEGGGDPPALLGLLRLVHWLAYGSVSGGGDDGHDPASASASASDAVSQHALGVEESAAPCGGGGGGGGGRIRRVTAVQRLPLATSTPYKLVVDSGTGTTAVGLALGLALLGLPWSVHAVALAGDMSYYTSQQEQLVRSFLNRYGDELFGSAAGCQRLNGPPHGRVEPVPTAPAAYTAAAAAGWDAVAPAAPAVAVAVAAAGGGATTAAASERGLAAAALLSQSQSLPLQWLPRPAPRRFGKVLEGEIAACRQIAQSYGIALDPIYSLAAWEVASREAADEDCVAAAAAAPVVGATAGRAVAATTAAVEGWLQLEAADPNAAQSPGRVESAECGVCSRDVGPAAAGAAAGRGRGVVDSNDPRVSGTGDSDDGPAAAAAAAVMTTGPRVVMLHGGGAMGLHGLAQRYPAAF